MHPLLEQQRAEGFPAFRGTDVRGRVPLRERTLNNALRALGRSGQLPGALAQVAIQIQADNRITLHGLPGPFSPTFRIDPVIDVAAGGRLTLRLQGFAALLGPVISLLVGALGRLPPGMTISGGVITVDVRAALEQAGQGQLARLIRQVRVATDNGILHIDFHIRVD
jgi:hypothetical protein